nr:unnamed protein product [Spirometra erinaceieuropaei]
MPMRRSTTNRLTSGVSDRASSRRRRRGVPSDQPSTESAVTCARGTTGTGTAIARLPQVATNADLDLPPSLQETIRAVQQLSSGKAPGSDAIPAEVYKHGGPLLMHHLTALFQEMWRQGEVPQDFKDATTVHLYKRKGNRQVCDNHRGISLLNIAGKIFARILLNRLNIHLEQGLLPESQCGFRRHRGTTDMIFAARQLQEKCQEMRTHLYSTFVDLTKAFDTVNREGLWKIMQKFGCPERFTQMVRQLHDGMMARVTDNGAVSEAFAVTNGVKQGCALAPTLFSLITTAHADQHPFPPPDAREGHLDASSVATTATLDYVLVRRRDQRDVLATKAVPGADRWTAHRLAISKLRICLQPRRRSQGEQPQDWFDAKGTAISNQPVEKNRLHKAYVSRLTNYNRAAFHRSRRLLQQRLREMQDAWTALKIKEIRGYADRNEWKNFFPTIKAVYGPPTKDTAPPLGADDSTLLTGKGQILQRWAEHFRGVLSRPSTISDAAIARLPQVEANADLNLPPSLHETIRAA